MAEDIHIALLRGINVGGKNKLPMKDLTAIFENAGCKNVQTYIQSGNVVFSAPEALAKKISSLISTAILKKFKLQIPVVAFSAKELLVVTKENPFLKSGTDTATLHVGFLADTPDKAAVAALDHTRGDTDKFEVLGRVIYFFFPKGLAKTKLTNAYFDSKLKTVSTMRNWNTVMTLLEITSNKK